MSTSTFRTALICVLVCVVPMQLVAADSASAMLYTSGSAWLNGTEVPKSAAVFNGDMVQTKPESSANINASGSSVMVLSDSLVKFEGPAVEIEHGAVRVGTSSGMATKAGEVTVKPAGMSWTEFQVADVDGQVQIAATKGDLTIQDQEGTTTLSQGQTTTKDDTSQPEKKKKKRRSGAATAAGGGILSSSYAVYGGAAIVGGITLWVLLQHDEPMSPDCPTNPCN
jgi:hypothetical protein